MKFSKSSWIILILGIVVLGAFLIGMVRTQQIQQQQNLEKTLLADQQKLALTKIDDLTLKRDQLTQEKELYTAQIAAAKAKLAAPVDNIAGTETILNSAHEFDLKIVNINSGGKSNSTYSGNEFTALSFNLRVEGNIDNIAGFISNIKTLFPTSVVEAYQVDINTPTPTPTTPATPTTTPTPTPTPSIAPTPTPAFILPINTAAMINIIIYDYKGDTNVE